MPVEHHLILQDLTLRPAGEWTPPGPGWTIARVTDGVGYLLQRGKAGELKAGDGFVTSGVSQVVLRASQLGALKLEYFCVQPNLLNGLITVAEGHQLQQAENNTLTQAIAFAAGDRIGQKFSHLVAQPQRESLGMRSALLQLWSQAIAGLLLRPPAPDHSRNLHERFRQLVAQMPDAELATRSLTELAGQLHCSERHFSRIFRAEFGIPLRARQTELRLLRAGQLLADGDAKIISVALESGYRHLGLFNLMFKKRYGATPSEWRRRHQKNNATSPRQNFTRSGRQSLALCLLLLQFFLGAPVFAQTTNSPATNSAAAAGPRFKVNKYLVEGNSVLPPAKLGQILTNVPGAFGTNVAFPEIRAALGELQMAYRERGFATVSVGLPPQKLTNATVKIKITEGRLAGINIKGNDYFSTPNVLRALPSLHTNMLLNSHVFQRELDLANANRNRQIYPVIGPGLEPGTSELTLKVKDRLPLHARVEINNQSTPGTPDSRVAFNAQYDNLWQLEHQVGVSYSFTPLDFKGENSQYFSPLDLPLIANYSGYYRMPLGRPASVQAQVDDSSGSFGYNEVTHQFRMPPPSGRPELTFYGSRSTSDTGVQYGSRSNVTETVLLKVDSQDSGDNITLNEGLGGKFSLPLPALGNLASTFFLGADFKRYRASSFNTNNFYASVTVVDPVSLQTNYISQTLSSGQPTRDSAVEYFPINFGVNGSLPDPWGNTTFNAQFNYNVATVGSLSQLAYSAAAGSAVTTNSQTGAVSTNSLNRARNNYCTVQAGLTREQRLYRDWTALIRADGQWTDRPLFSNEQFAMGGTGGVRGYSDGEAYGDAGWRVAVEPRTPMVNIGMVDGNVPFWVRASVFMDYGEIYLVQKISAASRESESFWGYGGSLTANIGSHLDARLTVAFPLLATALTPAQSVHVYFGVGAQF